MIEREITHDDNETGIDENDDINDGTNVTKNRLRKKEVNKQNDDDDGGWIQLMGQDLIMKKGGKVTFDDENNDDGNNNEEEYCEIGDAVYVSYVGRVLGDPDPEGAESQSYDLTCLSPPASGSGYFPVFTEVTDCLVTFGDADLVAALEMAIRFLPLRHQGIVRTRFKYAYGLGGHRQRPRPRTGTNDDKEEPTVDLPPRSSVEFHVVLRHRIAPTSPIFGTARCHLDRAASKKGMGNDVVKYEENWNRALKLYQSAIRLAAGVLESVSSSSNEVMEEKNNEGASLEKERALVTKEAQELSIDCLNNAALVYFRKGEFAKSKETACTVLSQWDADNVKALYRAAKACLQDPRSSFEEARLSIHAALEVSQKNDQQTHQQRKEVLKLRDEWKQKEREYRRKEKEMYAKMSSEIARPRPINIERKNESKCNDDDDYYDRSDQDHYVLSDNGSTLEEDGSLQRSVDGQTKKTVATSNINKESDFRRIIELFFKTLLYFIALYAFARYVSLKLTSIPLEHDQTFVFPPLSNYMNDDHGEDL